MVAPNIYTHRNVKGLGWIKRGSPAEVRYLKNKDKQKATAGKGKGAKKTGRGKGAKKKDPNFKARATDR